MKAASGELNLTVVTIIAIAAVAAIATAFWPTIQGAINDQWESVNTSQSNGLGKSTP